MPKLSRMPRDEIAPPGESDQPRSTGNQPVDEPSLALARPHPEGADPYEPKGIDAEAEADLAEQPSDTNPISSKSGP